MCRLVHVKNLHEQKKKSHLPLKLEKFLSKTESIRQYLKKEGRHQIHLQTDQEFNQNEIKETNKQYNVLHYNSKLNNRHTMAKEQKIRELKNDLKHFKSFLKKSKLKPNEALRKATIKMNIFPTKKII